MWVPLPKPVENSEPSSRQSIFMGNSESGTDNTGTQTAGNDAVPQTKTSSTQMITNWSLLNNQANSGTGRSDSPSSLHSSGGFAFFASRGSSHDVVLVLWLEKKKETKAIRRGTGGQTEVRERETDREDKRKWWVQSHTNDLCGSVSVCQINKGNF